MQQYVAKERDDSGVKPRWREVMAFLVKEG